MGTVVGRTKALHMGRENFSCHAFETETFARIKLKKTNGISHPAGAATGSGSTHEAGGHGLGHIHDPLLHTMINMLKSSLFLRFSSG